jgi:hypothetical protein
VDSFFFHGFGSYWLRSDGFELGKERRLDCEVVGVDMDVASLALPSKRPVAASLMLPSERPADLAAASPCSVFF